MRPEMEYLLSCFLPKIMAEILLLSVVFSKQNVNSHNENQNHNKLWLLLVSNSLRGRNEQAKYTAPVKD